MKATVMMCFLAALTGCTTQHAAVRCHGRLEPINQPAGESTRVSSVSYSTADVDHGEDDRE